MLFFILLNLLNLQKNIIIFIGDGMGPEQMKLIEENGYPWTSFDGFSALDVRNPFCGVPDSASSATTIFSGIFTKNGMVGMGINGKEYKTLGEIAKEKGYSVGVATDVEIYDATPAALYAHSKDRHNKEEILNFLKKSNFDLFIGKIDEKVSEKIINFNDEMDYLKILKNSIKKLKEPYFFLIEAGKIDWACHDNSLEKLKKEVDKAKKIIEFLIEISMKDKNTMVFITADHETGGFDFENLKFSTKSHTSQPVFVFSTEKFPELLINQIHLNQYILNYLK